MRRKKKSGDGRVAMTLMMIIIPNGKIVNTKLNCKVGQTTRRLPGTSTQSTVLAQSSCERSKNYNQYNSILKCSTRKALVRPRVPWTRSLMIAGGLALIATLPVTRSKCPNRPGLKIWWWSDCWYLNRLKTFNAKKTAKKMSWTVLLCPILPQKSMHQARWRTSYWLKGPVAP